MPPRLRIRLKMEGTYPDVPDHERVVARAGSDIGVGRGPHSGRPVEHAAIVAVAQRVQRLVCARVDHLHAHMDMLVRPGGCDPKPCRKR
jgi:hypothetical protein